MKQKHSLEDIESFYPSIFHPINDVFDSSNWSRKGFISIRCSVFPWFLSNVDELEKYVDNVEEDQKQIYRFKFLSFLNDINLLTTVYKKNKHENFLNKIELFSVVDVICLTEKNQCDLFIPTLKLIFWGHDDFGFIVLSNEEKLITTQIEELVKVNGLFLVRPS
jgi:hypothetical protein